MPVVSKPLRGPILDPSAEPVLDLPAGPVLDPPAVPALNLPAGPVLP